MLGKNLEILVLLVLVAGMRAETGLTSQPPSDAALQYKLGMNYRELGDNRRATVHLRAAVEGGFNNLAAQVNLIEAAFLAKQSALALATSKQLLDKPLRSADVPLRVGRVLFDHLFYREALHAFQKACDLAPANFEPRFRGALVSYLLGDYAAVVKALSNDAQTNAEAANLVASAEAKLGHYDRAQEILKSTIARVPESQHAYINLALIDLDQGKTGEAESMLGPFATIHNKDGAKVFYTVTRDTCSEVARDDAGNSVSSDQAAFYSALAAQLERGSNYLSAVALVALAQAHGEKSAQTLYVAAVSCFNHDPLSAAPLALSKEAIRLDPRFAQAYYLLGRVLTRQGKLDKAVDAFRHAADLEANPIFYVSLGKALRSETRTATRTSEVRAAYERALKIDPENARAHLELGRLFVETEQLKPAEIELQKALEAEPDFYEAAYLLGRLYHRDGNTQKSQEYMAQFAETKKALMEQAVLGAGYAGDDR